MARKENEVLTTRVSINLPIDLVNQVKEYATNLGVNTTSAYIILLNLALDMEKFKTYYYK